MNTVFTEKDKYFMEIAIKLSENGEGRVSPNPPVGCVLVKNEVIVGEGWHDRLGDLHAEAMALQAAGANAEGATAYVTLSPCTSHGRQPPCADALIRAKVARVVVAATDPNPGNASGLHVLNAAGIPAVDGLLRDEGEYQARGFFKTMRTGLPHVTLKYAMTLDGKTATHTGDSRWISGQESREYVQAMRSRNDAILVGSGTVLADNPLLTVRGPALERRGGESRHPQPTRVIADSSCRTPPSAAMFTQSGGGKVVIACVKGAPPQSMQALAAAGAEILEFDSDNGKVPLEPLLRRLAERGINMVMCESGGALAAALLKAGLLDEVTAFVAPKLIGGTNAPGPVGGDGFSLMADAVGVSMREWFRIGDDIVIKGTIA